MSMTSAKCTNCGANLEVDAAKDAAICPYCNAAYVVEKAINCYNSVNDITSSAVTIHSNKLEDFVIRAGELVKYNGADVDVAIPDNVLKIGDGAFSSCYGLKKVFIPDGVLQIGGHAFFNCGSLEEIIIPDTVEDIGMGAFQSCKNLKRIIMPKNLKKIELFTFKDCGLGEIDIPQGVTWIGGGAFEHCPLTEVVIPASVTTIGASAFHCDGLTITIPDSVTTISFNAFGDTWDYTESVKQINASNYWKEKNYNVAKCLSAYKPAPKQNSGCYIATAVYGSYDCPEVWVLRRFRDNELATTWYGRLFIRIYYTASPTLVKRFGHMSSFKHLWRKVLDALVQTLQTKGVSSNPYCDKEWKR